MNSCVDETSRTACTADPKDIPPLQTLPQPEVPPIESTKGNKLFFETGLVEILSELWILSSWRVRWHVQVARHTMRNWISNRW